MKKLKPGTLVMMMKNEDESLSPVGMNEEQAYIIRAFLSKLSEVSPFIIKNEERYVQVTRLSTESQ